MIKRGVLPRNTKHTDLKFRKVPSFSTLGMTVAEQNEPLAKFPNDGEVLL